MLHRFSKISGRPRRALSGPRLIDWSRPITANLEVYSVFGRSDAPLASRNLARGPVFNASAGTTDPDSSPLSGTAELFGGDWVGSTALSLADGADYTFACHVLTNSSFSGAMPIAAYGSADPAFLQHIPAASAWGITHDGNSGAATQLAVSTWYTLVASRIGGTIYFYRDGQPDGTAATTGANSATATFRIGHDGQFKPFQGSLAWFGFWAGRGLSASEAYQLHVDPWSVLLPISPLNLSGGQVVGGPDVALIPVGSVLVEGQDFSLGGVSHQEAAAGSVTLNGQTLGVRSTQRNTADAGSIVVNGQPVNLSALAHLVLTPALVSVIGQGVTARSLLREAVDAGNIDVNGQVVTISQLAHFEVAKGTIRIRGRTVFIGADIVEQTFLRPVLRSVFDEVLDDVTDIHRQYD
jgi:hypothetical protein